MGMDRTGDAQLASAPVIRVSVSHCCWDATNPCVWAPLLALAARAVSMMQYH